MRELTNLEGWLLLLVFIVGVIFFLFLRKFRNRKFSNKSVGGDSKDKFDYKVLLDIEKEKNKRLKARVKKLEKESKTDGLTGLGNQREFIRALNLETKRAKRNNNKLCLLFIDLNNFKSVNDQLGHQFGDEVLIKVSSVISDEIRLTDIACRPGGDEFAILLPEASEDGTVELVQRISERVDEICSELKIPTTINFGISIGGAEYDHVMRISEFVKQADASMYEVKAKVKEN